MAGKKLDISTRETTEKLVRAGEKFFKEYGGPKLLGLGLAKIFTGVRPGERFDVFIASCGHEQDPKGFFAAVFDKIARASSPGSQRGVVLNGIFVPVLFLYCLLEILHPLNRLTSVKTIDQLKEKTGLCLDDHTREAVQQVMDEYPVRLSDHVIRQSQVSDALAIQYLPFAEELDHRGRASVKPEKHGGCSGRVNGN